MKGIYVLIIKINKLTDVKIGALGNLPFQEGTYAYVGSAQNNLELRIKRHLSKNKKMFWHIDYLLADKAAEINQIYAVSGEKARECYIASLIKQKALPIAGFGCSDCRCGSHLFYGNNLQFLSEFMQPLKI